MWPGRQWAGLYLHLLWDGSPTLGLACGVASPCPQPPKPQMLQRFQKQSPGGN